MKKIPVFAAAVLLLAGCGVGNYSVSSGKSDAAELSVTAPAQLAVKICVDDKVYSVETVKTSSFKSKRDIKKTAQNTIKVEPGTHDVKIYQGENLVYSKKHVFSNDEHKVIEL